MPRGMKQDRERLYRHVARRLLRALLAEERAKLVEMDSLPDDILPEHIQGMLDNLEAMPPRAPHVEEALGAILVSLKGGEVRKRAFDIYFTEKKGELTDEAKRLKENTVRWHGKPLQSIKRFEECCKNTHCTGRCATTSETTSARPSLRQGRSL